MKILQRYILKEIFMPFVLSLATLNFIFMAGYLVKAANFIIGRGVPLWDTLYVLLLALPEMMSFTVPISVLAATLIVFGSLSQNNEIRAMKASGIHPLMVMAPAFLVGLLLSFGMFVFNDQIATNAGFELRRVTKKILIKHPQAMIEPGRFVKLNENIMFLAKEQKGTQIRNIIAYEIDESSQSNPIRTIMAESGEIVSAQDHTEMQIRLFDGSVSDSKDASVQSIQFKTYEFPTLNQEDIRKMKKKNRDYSLAELLIRAKEEHTWQDLVEIWSAFHQRIAFSFGSFIFIFIGVPIAVIIQRGEIVLSFGIAMASAGLYYILFVFAKTLSINGILPPMLAFWLPNVLLLGLGAKLLHRSFIL